MRSRCKITNPVSPNGPYYLVLCQEKRNIMVYFDYGVLAK